MAAKETRGVRRGANDGSGVEWAWTRDEGDRSWGAPARDGGLCGRAMLWRAVGCWRRCSARGRWLEMALFALEAGVVRRAWPADALFLPLSLSLPPSLSTGAVGGSGRPSWHPLRPAAKHGETRLQGSQTFQSWFQGLLAALFHYLVFGIAVHDSQCLVTMCDALRWSVRRQ